MSDEKKGTPKVPQKPDPVPPRPPQRKELNSRQPRKKPNN